MPLLSRRLIEQSMARSARFPTGGGLLAENTGAKNFDEPGPTDWNLRQSRN